MNTSEPTTHSLAMFEPRLDILPPAQPRLWPELSETPEEFTLYGGTAIALRLRHRPSVDFDFFASTPFVPSALLQKVPYLKGATVRQSAPNTLTVTVEREGPVQVSFFGSLELGQVASAETTIGPGINVASLIDQAGAGREARLRGIRRPHAVARVAALAARFASNASDMPQIALPSEIAPKNS